MCWINVLWLHNVTVRQNGRCSVHKLFVIECQFHDWNKFRRLVALIAAKEGDFLHRRNRASI